MTRPTSSSLGFLAAITFASVAGTPLTAHAGTTDFTLKSGDKPFKLSDARGKYVALHFLLKTECPYCLRHVQQYVNDGPRVAGVEHVFLKPDSEDDIREFASHLPKSDAPPVTIYRDADSKLARMYKVPNGYAFHGTTTTYPALILLGPDGKEVFRYVGKSNSDRLSFDKFAAKMAELTRNDALKEYNVKDGKPAMQGYDPVAYHESGSAVQGRNEIASIYRGVTYNFATTANRNRFAQDPEKYTPEYGGWCATAMAEGDKVDIDPTSFKVTNGRLFLFYKGWLGDARKKWEGDEKGLTKNADLQWSKLAPQDRIVAKANR